MSNWGYRIIESLELVRLHVCIIGQLAAIEMSIHIYIKNNERYLSKI